jgi:hypothetical protein
MAGRLAIGIVLIVFATSGVAMAACPPQVVGSSSEAVAANSQRLICLQAELAQATRHRQLEFQVDALERSVQSLNLQRRFDALPKPGGAYFP